MESIYSHIVSYKKLKKPNTSGVLVNLFIGSLALKNIGIFGDKPTVFWESKVGSIASSVNSLLNVENIGNMIAKKISYIESTPMFDIIRDDKNILGFPSLKFNIKLFTLNVELSAVSGKTNSDKLITIKKFFYQIDGFGGASTFSKFLEIIKLSFTSKISLKKAREMTISKKILVNNNLRKVNSQLD
ncbi:hypothetical protein G9A89_015732 [Geosiphon pyriformis]|nr:hypothetical protein G9A89_015732 [Geosiphon pyriformis]